MSQKGTPPTVGREQSPLRNQNRLCCFPPRRPPPSVPGAPSGKAAASESAETAAKGNGCLSHETQRLLLAPNGSRRISAWHWPQCPTVSCRSARAMTRRIQSVEVQGGSWDHQAEELKRLAETLPEFQARERPPGVPYRFLGYQMPNQGNARERRGLAVLRRHHESGVETRAAEPRWRAHTVCGQPIGSQEISNASLGEAREGTDPVCTNLVTNQAVSQLNAPQVPGISIF